MLCMMFPKNDFAQCPSFLTKRDQTARRETVKYKQIPRERREEGGLRGVGLHKQDERLRKLNCD